jgi:hypothetical protein
MWKAAADRSYPWPGRPTLPLSLTPTPDLHKLLKCISDILKCRPPLHYFFPMFSINSTCNIQPCKTGINSTVYLISSEEFSVLEEVRETRKGGW